MGCAAHSGKEEMYADCSRISIIDESSKSVSMADDRIEEAIRKENAKLLILDPIQAYLGGGIWSSKGI